MLWYSILAQRERRARSKAGAVRPKRLDVGRERGRTLKTKYFRSWFYLWPLVYD